MTRLDPRNTVTYICSVGCIFIALSSPISSLCRQHTPSFFFALQNSQSEIVSSRIQVLITADLLQEI